MHAHILDQSGDWERETIVAFQSTHLVSPEYELTGLMSWPADVPP